MRIRQTVQTELGRFVDFMEQRGVFFPADMQVEHLTEFRTTWEQWYKSSITRSKCQERMRAFFRYCHNARMIDRIPRMSSIKIVEPPTMPLTDEEYNVCSGSSQKCLRTAERFSVFTA